LKINGEGNLWEKSGAKKGLPLKGGVEKGGPPPQDWKKSKSKLGTRKPPKAKTERELDQRNLGGGGEETRKNLQLGEGYRARSH